MSIDSKQFATDMLLESDQAIIDYGLARERESMWPFFAVIVEEIILPTQTLVQLSADTVNVTLCSFNKKILTKTNELVLDSINHNWRQAISSVQGPRNWIYRGEQEQHTIRIYPPSALPGRLQVLKYNWLPPNIAKWHDVYLAFALMRRLAISDPLRSRPEIAKLAENIMAIMEKNLNGGSILNKRR